ncbi:helix-turn-helix domain-containing protein [Actinokineospora inagensis]|uniref:helix-turn-helix domain-containing protein n=1 Tax=Actinokineospora inagensis TaxID=103730 RepID=UPI00047DB38B|nr:helix-turn-helix transcriptional regulator [Actinokineospora inagensis]
MSGRYCMRCGGRLARDTRVSMCAPCRQVSGVGTDHAPDLGLDFWTTDQMKDAFATREMGAVVRAYRYHPAHGHKALPQETVSRWLGTVTQSQLSRIESGRNKVDTLAKLIHYARALKMPANLLWFSLPDEPGSIPLPRSDEVLALPDGPLVPAASINTGSAIADTLLKTLDHYASTDNLAGPRSLVQVVPQQLRFIEELLQKARGRDRAQLLRVAARYAEFAGWIYQDTGTLNAAMQVSGEALDFAQEAEDDELASYILMRRSNIAADAKRHDLALKLANAALTQSTKLTARLRALALRQQAHVYAQKGDVAGCARVLDVAFKLAERSSDSEMDLGHYCTPEYLEMEAAQCWVELGRPHEAIDSLRQGLSGWQAEFRRDLGLCLARLAMAHAVEAQADHAVQVARSATTIGLETRSHRIAVQLGRIPAALESSGADEEAMRVRRLVKSLGS